MFSHTICFSLLYSFPELVLCCWTLKGASSTQILEFPASKITLALNGVNPAALQIPWRILLQWWALLKHSSVILLKLAMPVGMT